MLLSWLCGQVFQQDGGVKSVKGSQDVSRSEDWRKGQRIVMAGPRFVMGWSCERQERVSESEGKM
jgi:hypothetical protein